MELPSSAFRPRGGGEGWRKDRRGEESLKEVEARSRAGDRLLSGKGERRRGRRLTDGGLLDDVTLSFEERRSGQSESLRSVALYDRLGGGERRGYLSREGAVRSVEGERRREGLLSR